MRTTTTTPTQACFDAWVQCEQLLMNLHEVKSSLSRKVTNVLDECALICMGTFQALKKGSGEAARMALLCVGICEECAEICEELSDQRFQLCAQSCRACSERVSALAFTAL